MSGILSALLAGVSHIVQNFSAWDVWANSTPGNTATATITINSNGSVAYSVVDSDGGSTEGSTSWYLPNTTGIGAYYWVRFTATAGTFTSNDASTWTQLSSSRSATKSATTGTASVTFTIEIAADSGGSTIVLTSTGNQLRYSHI